jgi:hypothetical protein
LASSCPGAFQHPTCMPERRQATRQSRPCGPVVAVFVRVLLPESLPATGPRGPRSHPALHSSQRSSPAPCESRRGDGSRQGDGQITCWLDLGLRMELHLPSQGRTPRTSSLAAGLAQASQQRHAGRRAIGPQSRFAPRAGARNLSPKAPPKALGLPVCG